MNDELKYLSVRIQDLNYETIGSGLLYIPCGSEFAYVLTAAHVVYHTEEPLLVQCYPGAEDHTFQVGKPDFRIHPRYDGTDAIQPWDAALIRIPYRNWMDTRSQVYFGEACEEMPVEGYVYTAESPDDDMDLDKVYFSPKSIVVGISRPKHRINVLLDGHYHEDPSERRAQWEGRSGGVLAAACQEDITLIGMILGIPGRNGHLDRANLADMTAIQELLAIEGISCNWREVTTGEAVAQASELIYESIAPDRCFVHREAELARIEELLGKYGLVVLSGMGGIGKSGLAEQYASNTGNTYRHCPLISCRNSIASGLAAQLKIKGVTRGRINGIPEDDLSYSRRLLAALKRQQPGTWLLILDDVDPSDALCSEIAALRQHRIITSRWTKDQWRWPVIEIESMDFQCQKDLFEQYLGYELSEAETREFRAVSGIVGGHTLTLQLIALQCCASDYTVGDIRRILMENGIYTENPDQFSYSKAEQERNMYGHIRAIWNLSAFSDAENRIMQGLCLITGQGIPRAAYKEWMALPNMNAINRLRRQGWIRSRRSDDESRTDYISLHHVISEVIYQELYLKAPADLDGLIDGAAHFVNQRSQPLEEQSYWIATGIHMGQRLLASVPAALLLNQVGLHLEYMRDLDLSLEMLFHAQNQMTALKATATELYGHILNNIALVYHTAGNYPASMEYYQKAIAVYRRLGTKTRPNYAYALHNIARLQWFMGEHESAMETENKAEPIIKNRWRQHLGEVYDLRREYHTLHARQAYIKYNTLRSDPDTDRNYLRGLYNQFEKHRKKLLHYSYGAVAEKKKYAPHNIQGYMISLSYLACAKAQFEPDREQALSAREDIHAVLSFYLQTTGPQSIYVGETYSKMCTIYEKLGDPEPACKFGEEALRILSMHEEADSEAVVAATQNLRIAQKSLQKMQNK